MAIFVSILEIVAILIIGLTFYLVMEARRLIARAFRKLRPPEEKI